MFHSNPSQCLTHEQTKCHTGLGGIVPMEGKVVTHQGGVDPTHDPQVGGHHVVLLLLLLR